MIYELVILRGTQVYGNRLELNIFNIISLQKLTIGLILTLVGVN